MTIAQLAPFIFPAILTQGSVQAYFIWHCWNQPKLSLRQKTFHLILIALFNLPGTAFYLLRSPSLNTPPSRYTEGENDKNQLGIHVLLLLAYEVFALRLLFNHLDIPAYTVLSSLVGFGLLLLLLQALPLLGYGSKASRRRLLFFLTVMQIIVVAAMFHLSPSLDAQLIVLTIVASLINAHSLKSSLRLSLFVFAIYAAILVHASMREHEVIDFDELIGNLYVDVLFFLLVLAAFYSLQKQLQLNKQLQKSMQRQKEQAAQLEKLATMRERQRIVGQIHDTVGHRLTTALILLQKSLRMLPADAGGAPDSINLAHAQVKEGLADLRQSVRTIQSGQEKPYDHVLSELVAEIEKTAQIKVEAIVDLENELLPIQQTLLTQAIREAVTNGLKHGHCQRIDLLLQEYRGKVQLTISDDGHGTDGLEFGFGLSSLRKRAESLGGTLWVESSLHEGCTLQLTLPLGESHETTSQI